MYQVTSNMVNLYVINAIIDVTLVLSDKIIVHLVIVINIGNFEVIIVYANMGIFKTVNKKNAALA